MHKHATEIFRKFNFTPQVGFYLDLLITSYSLAASNNGLCFVTDTLLKYHRFNDDVILYNITGSGSRTLYITKKRNRFTTNAMNRFIDITQKYLSENN